MSFNIISFKEITILTINNGGSVLKFYLEFKNNSLLSLFKILNCVIT